jgi:acyl-coenzyme A thioesterase PaaI-like protein
MTVDTPPAGLRLFSQVTELRPLGPGRFSAEVDPEWTIAGKPNGGCLLATLCRAATYQSAHDHVIAASAHFVRSPGPGPAVIAAEALREGRSATQVRASLSQDGQLCVEALITAAHLESETRPFWDQGLPEASKVSLADCPRLPPVLPTGESVAILRHAEVRFEPSSLGFARGEPTGRGELRGWLALPGGENFDPASLVFAVDSFPPATFDIQFSGWVPTLEMTVYVRALPAPGPVRVLQRALLIDAGRVDEACFVWDSAGRLVAQGTQLAGIRLG